MGSMANTSSSGEVAQGLAGSDVGSPGHESQLEHRRRHLASWRERLLRHALLALAALHLLGALHCLVSGRSSPTPWCLGLVLVALTHVMVARATGYLRWRVGWMLSATYVVLAWLLATSAWSPPFALLALLFVGLSAAFLGRPGLYAAAVGVLLLLVVGGLAVSTGWTFDANVIRTDSAKEWVQAGAFFAVIVGAMAHMLRFALDTLVGSQGSRQLAQLEVDQERKRLASLRMSRERLEARVLDAHKLQTVDQLSDGIAHQLGNAVTTIRGATELLRHAASRREIHDAAAEVVFSVERTAATVRSLLVFSRRDQERLAPLSLAEELASVRATLEETLPANISLETIIQASPVVLAERKRLRQLVFGLVLNGRDAIAGTGSISLSLDVIEVTSTSAPETVTVLAEGSYAALVVADDGRGMPPEVAARAFEPFFSTKPSKRHEGLGLFVVFGLLRQWGGSLRIDSEPGRGTRVTVYLPVTSDAPVRPAAPNPVLLDDARSPSAANPAVEGSRTPAPVRSEPLPASQHGAPEWKRSSLGRALLVVGLVYLWTLPGIVFMSGTKVGANHLLLLLTGMAALASWRAKRLSHDLRAGFLVLLTMAPSIWIVLDSTFMAPAALIGMACAVLFAAAYSNRILTTGILSLAAGLLVLAPWLPVGTGMFRSAVDPTVAENWWRETLLVPVMCVTPTWLLLDILRAARRSLAELDLSLDALGGTRERLASEAGSLAVAEHVAERAAHVEVAGQLAGAVAHDLGNALTAVLGWASLLLNDPAPLASDVETAVRAFDESADYAQTLLSQLTTHGEHAEPGPSDISLVVQRLESVVKRLVGGNVTVEVQLAPHCVAPVGKSNLERVLLNLASNARDAMPEGGTLTICVSRFDERVRVAVRDTGVGMDETTQGRLFEAFYTTKAESQGTGLGLHSVARIMELTGGEVLVTSQPGAGSEITLEWPAIASSPRAPASRVDRVNARQEATILLAEDDETVRWVMTQGLLRAGYSVVPTRDGTEVEARLRERDDWDALCIDAVMPGRPSVQLVQDFQDRYPGRPVLLVSGQLDGEMAVLVKSREIRFLSKPFSPSDLVAALQEELRRVST